MRKLMWFTIGFCAACAFGAYLYVPWILPAALLVFLLALLFACLTWWRKNFRLAAVACIGAAVGLGWFSLYDTLYIGNARTLDGLTEHASIVAMDHSYSTNYGSAVDGMLELDGKPYRVLVYLDEHTDLKPGDRVVGEFKLRLTTNGGEKEPTYRQSEGVFLTASARSACRYEKFRTMGLLYYPAVWREALLDAIRNSFPEDTSGFACGLLLGDRSGIDYKTNTAFKVSGISHIIAVSGLHVSILFSVIYILTLRRRYLTALIGIPVLILFAALAGFTPSITRACIMQCLLMLSRLWEQEYDPATSLSFAALVMLICNPLVITSVSFQLSFGCMAGIILYAEPLRSWILGEYRGKSLLARLIRWFAGSVSITLSAMVFTTPLVAVYFGAVSLVGILTNLMTLWAVSFIFYGIVLVCIVSFISASAAGVLGGIFAWLIRYVLITAQLLSELPLAAVYTKSIYIVLWLIFGYGALAVFLQLRRKPVLLFSSVLLLGLAMAIGLSWLDPMMGACRVTVLDVGQGQSIILRGNDKTFLVDCGGSSDTAAADMAAETLLSQGISRLDGIVITHFDRDHCGGLEYLLTRIDTDLLILPAVEDEYGLLDPVCNRLGDSVFYVDQDVLLEYRDVSMTIFEPATYESGNESSLSILFQVKNCDILITGDRGISSEQQLLKHDLPTLDVLVVGHHGSKKSTGEALLEATTPKYAIISVGESNSYGHPAQEVLDRLLTFGCIILRTDLYGTIVYRG